MTDVSRQTMLDTPPTPTKTGPNRVLLTISTVLVAIILAFAISKAFQSLASTFSFWQSNSCRIPVKYTLGDLDPRFGLSKEEALAAITSAEQAWEQATGVNMFDYDPAAGMKINFVFDERQELEREYFKLDELNKVYDARLSTYNKRVDSWNANPASASESSFLKKERAYLDLKYEELNTENQRLETWQSELIKKFGKDINSTKSYAHGSYFASTPKLNETVDIYAYLDKIDLERLMAHELGHSIGLGHLENKKSVMYSGGETKERGGVKPDTTDALEFLNFCSFIIKK